MNRGLSSLALELLGGGQFDATVFTLQQFVAELRSGLPRLHFSFACDLMSIAAPNVVSSLPGSSSDFWPCPLPRLPFLHRRDAGARRRRRWRQHVVARELTWQVVGALNYLALGSGRHAYSSSSRCPAPSAAQWAVLQRIEARTLTSSRRARAAGSVAQFTSCALLTRLLQNWKRWRSRLAATSAVTRRPWPAAPPADEPVAVPSKAFR